MELNDGQALVVFALVYCCGLFGGMSLLDWVQRKYGDRAEKFTLAFIGIVILTGAWIHFSP